MECNKNQNKFDLSICLSCTIAMANKHCNAMLGALVGTGILAFAVLITWIKRGKEARHKIEKIQRVTQNRVIYLVAQERNKNMWILPKRSKVSIKVGEINGANYHTN